jgi:cytochrome c
MIAPGKSAKQFSSAAQQAWDVAAFMISKPHPAATAETESELQ